MAPNRHIYNYYCFWDLLDCNSFDILGACRGLRRHPSKCLYFGYSRLQSFAWEAFLLIWIICYFRVYFGGFGFGECNLAHPTSANTAIPVSATWKSDDILVGFFMFIRTGLVELSVLISEVVKSSRLSSLSWLSTLSIFLSGDYIAFEMKDSSTISILDFNYYVFTITFSSRLSETFIFGYYPTGIIF